MKMGYKNMPFKKALYLSAFGILLFFSCNKSHIPPGLNARLTQIHPDVKAEWEKTPENMWLAHFEIDGNDWEAYFTEDMMWLGSKQKINRSDIPVQALNYLNLMHHTNAVDFYQYINPDGSWLLAEMKNDSLKISVLFDEKGFLIKDDYSLPFNNLREHFLTARNIKWVKNDTGYMATFHADGKMWQSWFSKDASLTFSETKCSIYEIPARVADAIKHLPSFTLSYVIKRTSKDQERYAAIGLTNEDEQVIYFDEEGNRL